MANDYIELDEMGPVDYMVIEFPDFRVTGDGLSHLVDLVDAGIIRVLDLVFVHKTTEGEFTVVAIADLDGDGVLDLAVLEGANTGLLADDDLREAAEAIAPGSAAGILVYENRWAAPMARTLRRDGAQLVAGGRIPIQAILASLEAMEPATA
jgi:hypothetical protein